MATENFPILTPAPEAIAQILASQAEATAAYEAAVIVRRAERAAAKAARAAKLATINATEIHNEYGYGDKAERVGLDTDY